MLHERRRFPRYPVSWPVRLWVSERVVLRGQTVDASVKGLRIALETSPPDELTVGARYRLEVMPDDGDRFACLAEVRHIGAAGIGLENLEDIPLSLILRDSTGPPAGS